jgi:CDP-4-dehydro-6-deoxyglucose reductase
VRQLELHIRHMPRGLFTDHVFGHMKVRDIHRVEFPLGSFFLREGTQRPMVMVASGTGFAPIKSIIEYSLQRGINRPIHLYWGGRRREDIYMMEQAQAWAAQHPHIQFVPVLSEPTAACQWQGRQGFVHNAVIEDFSDLSQFEVYACGSPIVIESARRDFVGACRLDESRFYADSFLTMADKSLTC